MSVCVMCVCVCVRMCVCVCVRLPSLCFKSCSVFLKSKRVVRSVLSALPLPFSLLFLLVSAFRTAVYCQPDEGGGVPARSGWGGGDAIGYWQPESRFHSEKIVPEDITLFGE